MGRHSLFPGFVKFTYVSNSHTHHQVLPIGEDPTPVGDSFTIPTRGSGAVDWQTAAAAWATLIAGLFDTSSSVSLAELYNFEAEPGPADFLQAVELDVAGTSGDPAVEFVQEVYPFKGVGGTSLRLTFLETFHQPDLKAPASAFSGVPLGILNFVLSDDCWIVTRAGGFPTVSLGFVTKTNDQLRKRYFNP